jgi:hypothetical protein
LFRKLSALDIFYYMVLSGGLVVAQARSFYIAWILVTVITMALILRRDLGQFLIIISIMITLISSLIMLFPEQMSYGISGKNTIAEGRMAQWIRADELSERFPITGIGPKETVFGSGTDLSGGGRWYSLYTESGYRMGRVSGGFIGLSLIVILMATSLFLAFQVLRDKGADQIRRRGAFASFYFLIAISIGLYITNIFENELMTFYGMTLAAIVAPQLHEIYKAQRNKRGVLVARIARARARMASNAR